MFSDLFGPLSDDRRRLVAASFRFDLRQSVAERDPQSGLSLAKAGEWHRQEFTHSWYTGPATLAITLVEKRTPFHDGSTRHNQ